MPPSYTFTRCDNRFPVMQSAMVALRLPDAMWEPL